MQRVARSLLLAPPTGVLRQLSAGCNSVLGAEWAAPLQSPEPPQAEAAASQQSPWPSACSHQCFGTGVRHASSVTSWWDARFRRREQPASSQQQQGEGLPPDAAAETTSESEPSFWPLPEGSDEALAAITHAVLAGDLSAIAQAKQDAFFTSAWIMTALQYLHDKQGLSWWGAIAALNLLTKLVTFPLALLSQRATAQTVEINSQMAHISALQRAAQTASTPEEAQSMQQAAQKAYVEYTQKHGSPFRSMMKMPAIMIANATIFLSVFNGVRSLMASKAHTLTVGGMLWFTDLTSYDPYYGLPVMCAAATIAMVARGMNIDGLAVTDSQMSQQKMIKYMLYGAGLMFIPAGGMVPAGVGILWVSNSCFSVLQGMAMRDDRFRRLIGLPTMAEMREKNKLIAAQQAAATTPPATAAPTAYDPDKAAADLLAKVQKDAQGRPVLYAQNPNMGGRRRASRAGGR